MRTITLGCGLCALVDDDDYGRIIKHNWYLFPHDATVYARTGINHATVYLHRFIMGGPPGDDRVIDHINGKGYDCRRANLRWVTTAENNRNFHPCEWRWVRRRGDGTWGYMLQSGLIIGGFSTAFAAALAFDNFARSVGSADLCHFPPMESVEYARTFEELPRGN